jgi:predicted SAM-dependent methyltransferase
MKLHIGCGDRKRDGYVNIDTRETAATDMVADAWNLAAFADGTVAEVYSRHMLEHLHPGDARRTVQEWHRVLAGDGVLHLIVPDLIFHCRQLLGEVQSGFKDQRQHAFASIYGWRSASFGGERFDVHLWGYDEPAITELLRGCGFARVERVRAGPDSEPWHLNVRAWKGASAG